MALAEFRGTAPSQSIAERLNDAGFVHQLSTVDWDEPRWNAVFLASRYQVRRVIVDGAPEPELYWLLAEVKSNPSFHVGTMHVPFWEQWYAFLDATVKVAENGILGPGIIIGDTNCALTGLDEDTADSADFKDRFAAAMLEVGWRDMFRVFHPQADAPTWYSTYGNGFRLDHAYVSAALQPTVKSCGYDWGRVWNEKKLSDHAAILLDLQPCPAKALIGDQALVVAQRHELLEGVPNSRGNLLWRLKAVLAVDLDPLKIADYVLDNCVSRQRPAQIFSA